MKHFIPGVLTGALILFLIEAASGLFDLQVERRFDSKYYTWTYLIAPSGYELQSGYIDFNTGEAKHYKHGGPWYPFLKFGASPDCFKNSDTMLLLRDYPIYIRKIK